MFNLFFAPRRDGIEVESELPDPPEAAPVMRGYPMRSEPRDVIARRVSGIRVPAVSGVPAIERGHQPVARDLRENRRAGDAEAPRIAMNHRGMRYRQSPDVLAVDHHMVGRERQPAERAAHGERARLVDVDPVYLADRSGAERDADGALADLERELDPRGGRELLRIVDARYRALVG